MEQRRSNCIKRPLKYIEEDEIKFIDTAIESISVLERVVSKYQYKCETTPVKSYFPTKLSDGVSIENGRYGIECYPNCKSESDVTKLFSKPILVEKNCILYESVFDNSVDVSYVPISNGVKEEMILKEYPGSNIFEFEVELDNLVPVYLTGDSIPLKDKDTGEQVAAISQIDMRDSASATTYNTSLFNHIELELIEDSTYILRIILDDVFLKAKTTVYPVIVDPTITFNADPIYDAPVFSGYPSTNFNSNTYNVVGYHGSSYGEGIGFIKINNIQNYLYIRPENITSAYLKLYESSGKASSATIGVYNTKATWSNTSITYSNKPTLNAEPYSTLTVTNSGWYNFDISGFIRTWLRYALNEGGKSQDYGLALKMTTTGVSSRHFCSANHSTYPPSIIINYTEYTGLAEGNYIIRSQYHPEAKPYCYLYASGSNVIQYTAKGNANQIWKVDYVGGGYYEIYSTANSSVAMGVASLEPSNATNVGLYDSSAGSRRKFRIIKNADGSYRILSICGNKNKGLDVCGPSNAAGTNIQSWEYSGVTQQQWNFYKAAPCGYLSYWYCDSTKISHLKNNQIKIFVDKTAGFGKTRNTLITYTDYALDVWRDLGYSYTFVDSADECNIHVRGITRNEALSIDENSGQAEGFCINIGYDGTIATYEGQAFSSAGWKSVYSTTKRSVYIIWDTNGNDGTAKTSDNSTLKWKAVVAHELGHALGHEGHDTSVRSIMFMSVDSIYKDPINVTGPQERDFLHLKQVY